MATSLKTPIYDDQLTAWHNRRLWFLLCGAGGVIAILSVALCVILLRPHSAPWVIEVNGKGEPMGSLLPLSGSTEIGDSTIRFELETYIQHAFHVSPNFEENKLWLSTVYAMSTKQAADALTFYYRADGGANNPLVAFTKYWQAVRIVRTLKLPIKDTYQIDYTVDRHDKSKLELTGTLTNWRATLRVIQGKPADGNPLGIWVTDLDFQPEAKS